MSRLNRFAYTLLWALLGTAMYLFLITLPIVEGLFWSLARNFFSPIQLEYMKYFRGGMAILMVLAIYRVTLKFVPEKSQLLQKLQLVNSFILARLVPVALGLGLAIFYLAWLPHYLYWPMWMDSEHFAISAQAWENGVRPYRDLIDFNFPGPIYFFWLIGKIFGWGRPMLANLVDAIVLLSLGAALFKWSRAVFQSIVPGLLGFFLITRYYLSLDYARVMQRDWFVFYFGTLAILIIQAWKNEKRWALAGSLIALGLVIRPYAIFWSAPVLVALWVESNHDLALLRKRLTQFLISGVASSLLLWSPLFYFQLFDDLLGHLSQELLQANYASKDSETWGWLIWDLLARKTEFAALLCLAASGWFARGNKSLQSLWLVWCSVFLVLLFYKPICPVRHNYTEIPFSLTACLWLGLAYGFFMKSPKPDSTRLLIALSLWFYCYFPGMPQMASFHDSSLAVQAMIQQTELQQPPPGCRDALRARASDRYLYSWRDYQDLLHYIRHELPPEVRVVNFLLYRPFPALNAPTGRLSLWPCGEGVLWLSWVHQNLEPDFARVLDSNTPAVVVMSDEKPHWAPPNRFPLIEQKIRENFEPVARKGVFQIWARRKSDNKTKDCQPARPPDG